MVTLWLRGPIQGHGVNLKFCQRFFEKDSFIGGFELPANHSILKFGD